ncbi:hypothetical protein J4422_02435 [Candidatus Pacearchaeota archaeon]|nr:hypothetical protein [Candidatus Pacearchaeota archaeon]
MAIQFIKQDDGTQIMYAGTPSLEGRRLDRSWYVNAETTYPTIVAYLTRLGPEVVGSVKHENGEIIYGLNNGGEIKTSRNPFGGIEVKVLECPEGIYDDLKEISAEIKPKKIEHQE